MGAQTTELIQLLRDSLDETLRVLAVLSDAELDDPSEHPCAMGGSVRHLLTHNIDHDRMHLGQVHSARYSLRQMQFSPVDRLLAETLRARMDLIAALIGLPDDALDARTPADEWTIRQMIEHTVYWERHSLDDLALTKLAGRVRVNGRRPEFTVADPIEGPLARPDPAA
jgi:uncharacterized damage-inducible protein DinB